MILRKIVLLFYSILLILRSNVAANPACVIESANNRVYGYPIGDFDTYLSREQVKEGRSNSRELCKSLCGAAGKQYAAIYGQYFCSCGTTAPANLFATCSSDISTAMVYQASIPATNVIIKVTKTKEIVSIDEKVSITYSLIDKVSQIPLTSLESMSLEILFSDSPKTVEYLTKPASTIDLSFFHPGVNSVRITLVDGSQVKVSMTVVSFMVYETTTTADVIFNCPTHVGSNLEYQCKLEFKRGSHLFGTINKNGITERFSISDPKYDFFGFIPKRITGGAPSTSTGLVISGFDAKYSGTIHRVHAHFTTANPIKFLLIRRACLSTENYNYFSQKCELLSMNSTQTCTNGQLFSMIIKDCSCTMGKSLKTNTDVSPFTGSVRVVNTFDAVPTANGFQTFSLATNWEVLPGDRLAILSPSGTIRVDPLDPNEANDLIDSTIKTNSFTVLTTSKLLAVKHQFGAVIFSKNDLTIQGVESSGVDKINYKVTLQNYNSPVMTFERSLNVIEPVNATDLTRYNYTTGSTTLVLRPYSGTNVKLLWNFNDSSPSEESTVGSISHNFAQPGAYDLVVNLTTLSNFFTLQRRIFVDSRLVATTLNCPPGRVGVASNCTISLTSGSSYTCNWRLGSMINTTTYNTPIFRRVFDEPTTLNVNVLCSNWINSFELTSVLRVFFPIEGLQIVDSFISLASPVVRFQFSRGSSLSVSLRINSVAITTTVSYDQRQIASAPLSITAPTSLPYTANISNPLGSVILNGTLQFDRPISGIRVTRSLATAQINQNIDFTVFFSAGTSISLFIDYMDGTNRTFTSFLGDAWPQAGRTYQKTFTREGIYTVNVVGRAGGVTISQVVMVSIFGNIGSYQLLPTSNFTANGTAFNLGFSRINGTEPVSSSLLIDWGDGTTATRVSVFNESSTYPHVYANEGTFTISATIVGQLNSVSATKNLIVQRPIEGFSCSPMKMAVVKNSTVSFKFSKTAGDNAIISFSGSQFPNISMTANDVPYAALYNRTGTFDGTALACNNVNCQSCNFSITAATPINNINVSTSQSDIGLVEATIIISYTGLPQDSPSDVTYVVDWADGRPVTEPERIMSFPFTLKTNMRLFGWFNATVTLKNSLDEKSFTREIGTFVSLSQVSTNLYIGSGQQLGYGINQNLYPIYMDLMLALTSPNAQPGSNFGTCNYTLMDSSGSVIGRDSFRTSSTTLQLYQMGEHRLILDVRNPFESQRYSMLIVGSSGVRNLRIKLLEGVLKPRRTGNFYITVDSIAPTSCICFSDDSSLSYFFMGPSFTGKTCSACPSAVLQRLWFDDNNRIIIKGVYIATGTYTPRVTAVYASTQVSNNVTIIVTDEDCLPPVLEFENSEITSSLTPKVSYYSDSNTLSSLIKALPCNATQNNTKEWKLYKINDDTLAVEYEIETKTMIGWNSVSLVVPPFLLKLGFYKMEFSVTMQTKSLISKKIVGFLQIVPAPLVVRFYPGAVTLTTLGIDNREFCFYPQNFTIDPNIPANSAPGIKKWEWSCVRKGEKSTRNLVTPKPRGFKFPIVKRGCFGDGPGIIANATSGFLCFNSMNMDIGLSYDLSVTATKGPLQSTATLGIFVTSGTPPNIIVNCAQPRMCDLAKTGVYAGAEFLITRSNDLVVNATCTGSGCDSVQRIWNLYPIVNGNLQAKVGDVLMNRMFGRNEQVANFPKTFFENLPNLERFKVCFIVGTAGAKAETCGQFSFRPNPFIGIWLSDIPDVAQPEHKYCFSNQGSDNNLEFQFILTNGVDQIALYSGTETNFCTTIPLLSGKLNVLVKAKDKYGSMVEKVVKSFTLATPSSEALQSTIDMLNSGKNSQLASMINSGSIQKSSSLLLSMATSIQLQSAITVKKEDIVNITTTQAEAIDLARDQRSSALKTILKATESLTPTSIGSLEVLTNVLSTVSQSGKDLNRESQHEIASQALNLVGNLDQLVNKASVEQINSVVGNSLKTMMNLVNSAATLINDAVPADRPKSLKDISYDASLDLTVLSDNTDYFEMEARRRQAVISKNLAENMKSVIDKCKNTMSDLLVPGGPAFSIESDSGSIQINKLTAEQLSNSEFATAGSSSSAKPPDMCEELKSMNLNCSDPSVRLTATTVFNNVNKYNFVDNKTVSVPDFVGNFELSYSLGKGSVKVQNTSQPFEIFIGKNEQLFIEPGYKSIDPSNESALLPEPMILPDNSEIYPGLLVSSTIIHETNVGFHVEVKPERPQECPQYLIIFSFIDAPMIAVPNLTPNISTWRVLPTDLESCNKNYNPEGKPNPWMASLDNKEFTQLKDEAIRNATQLKWKVLSKEMVGTLYYGYRQISMEESLEYRKTKTLPIPYPYRDQIKNILKFRTFTSSCVYYDEEKSKWNSDGCLVGPKTTMMKTHCLCTHLTSFSSSFAAPVNTIDFAYIMKNIDFSKNATLYTTEIVVAVILFLLFIYARRADKKDKKAIGVTPLVENEKGDDYFYEIMVNTGKRTNSGTESNVSLIITAEAGDTKPILLKDDKRKILMTGQTDRFLYASKRNMGVPKFLRVWHNNSGLGMKASWFCNYIMLVDLQTKEKYLFLIEKWFAVDQDDGKLDRVIPLSGTNDATKFQTMFTDHVGKKITEGHLWISIFARPKHSRFSRVERLASGVMLVFLKMVVGCMFFKGDDRVKQNDLFSIGPFAVSTEVVVKAILTNLIVTIPTIIVLFIFRKSKTYKSHARLLRSVIEEHLGEKLDIPKDKLLKREKEATEEEDDDSILNMNSSKRLWPWWLRIIAWIIIVVGSILAIVFTTFYGIMFGEAACKKWLSSWFLSYGLGVLITQPLKIVVFGFFLSLLCKSTDKIGDIEYQDDEELIMDQLYTRYVEKYNDKMFLHDGIEQNSSDSVGFRYLPPDENSIAKARKIRALELKMDSSIKEIVIYCLFFIILMVNAAKFTEENLYHEKKNLEKIFFKDVKIKNEQDMWDYVNTKLFPNLFAKEWYNGIPPIKSRGFIIDKVNRIIGYPILRQLRIKPDICYLNSFSKRVALRCNPKYSSSIQDKRNYDLSWKKLPTNKTSPNGFGYVDRSSLETPSMLGKLELYPGDGYFVNLTGNLDTLLEKVQYLQNSNWIDKNTRALIFEINVYNPNVNMFSVMSILFEFPGYSGIFMTHRIEPIIIRTEAETKDKKELGIQGAFIVLLLFYLYKEARKLWKSPKTYFSSLWTYVDLCLIIGSFVGITSYVYLINKMEKVLNELKLDNGNQPKNLLFLAYYNETLNYLIGIVVFCGIIKVLYIFRMNNRVNMLGEIFKIAAKSFAYFFMSFLVLYFSFVMMFYILYNKTLEDFRTLLQSMQTCFYILLNKFDFKGMYQKEIILGPILFGIFSIFFIFIMLSIFIVILEEALKEALCQMNEENEDNQLFAYMGVKLLVFLRLDRTGFGANLIDHMKSSISALSDMKLLYQENEDGGIDRKISTLSENIDEVSTFIKMTHQELCAPEEVTVNVDSGKKSKGHKKKAKKAKA